MKVQVRGSFREIGETVNRIKITISRGGLRSRPPSKVMRFRAPYAISVREANRPSMVARLRRMDRPPYLRVR